MFQFSKKSISMIPGFNNLALVLTIEDASDIFIYVHTHFSQSGLRKLMSSIIYFKQGKSEGFDTCSCDRPSNSNKTIGHLFYATSSYVHDFIAICEFKLELHSGNS